MSHSVRCPYCYSLKIKKDGYTIKGFQRFFCYLCGRYWQDVYVRKNADLLTEQKNIFLWIKQYPLLSPYLISVLPVNPDYPGEGYHLLLMYPNSMSNGLWIHLTQNAALAYPLNSSGEIVKMIGYDVKIATNCAEVVRLIKSYLDSFFRS